MTENRDIQFTLDDHTVTGKPDEVVLSIAKRNGVDIPALCHHESVMPYGACRLCLVEVFWGKRSKLVTSCIYVPHQDDVIEADNERIRRTRRVILELLLARCPNVDVIRKLADEYDVEESRLSSGVDSSPLERCIMCGLCVRVCDEMVGQHAIGYADRGAKRVIATPFDGQAEECIGCGACVFVCPTRALHYEDIDGKRIMKELKTTLPLVKCRVCDESFATEKQIAKVRERLKITQELAETCPRCRAAESRRVMVEALVGNISA